MIFKNKHGTKPLTGENKHKVQISCDALGISFYNIVHREEYHFDFLESY